MSDDLAQTKIAALAAIGDLIVYSLSNEYDKTEILRAIEDVKVRFAWQPDDDCLVYSRSTRKWCDGQIVHIAVDDTTKKEWLTVKYQKQKKQIQRFSSGLMPIGMDKEYRCNQVIIQRILNEMGISIQNDIYRDQLPISWVTYHFRRNSFIQNLNSY